MRQTHQDPDESMLRDSVPVVSRADDTTHVEPLSDRQAVIAVMASGGLTCDEIALVLPIPVRTIEDDLRQAMSILGLSDIEALTHLVVATYCDRIPPTSGKPGHQVENTAHLTGETRNRNAPTLGERAQAPRGVEPDMFAAVHPAANTAVSTSSHAGSSAISLALLDAAEAAQVHAREPADPTGPGSGSGGIGRPR
jgi:DNA-binding CsgD family transcriptional regulator